MPFTFFHGRQNRDAQLLFRTYYLILLLVTIPVINFALGPVFSFLVKSVQDHPMAWWALLGVLVTGLVALISMVVIKKW